MEKKLQIAIDGPVAAGKGTIAKKLAEQLNLLYVDTGAMYRAIALLGIRNKVDLKDEKKLLNLAQKSKIEFRIAKRDQSISQIFLNDENISKAIRTPLISSASSLVAILPEIRKFLVKKQQEIIFGKNVVMEGRDITTRVLPNATLKIFLTADINRRAERRKEQLEEKGIKKSFKEILIETQERDRRDFERENDPLQIVSDAYVLDTTGLTIEQTINKIIEKLKEKIEK